MKRGNCKKNDGTGKGLKVDPSFKRTGQKMDGDAGDDEPTTERERTSGYRECRVRKAELQKDGAVLNRVCRTGQNEKVAPMGLDPKSLFKSHTLRD